MNFLLPAGLGLFALAVPIILLYLIRQRLRVRLVSTMLSKRRRPSTFWTTRPGRLS